MNKTVPDKRLCAGIHVTGLSRADPCTRPDGLRGDVGNEPYYSTFQTISTHTTICQTITEITAQTTPFQFAGIEQY